MTLPEKIPPWDHTLRPSTGDDGRQLAPEQFARWVLPAAWEDTNGAVHLDVRAFHRWLGWPLNETEIRDTTELLTSMLKQHLGGAPLIVRP